MTRQLWRTITANALWRGVQLGSVWLLNVAIARVFQAEGSGNFLFLIANFQLAAGMAGLSIDSGIQYYGAADTALLGPFSRFIFRYTLLVTGILLGILAILIPAHVLRPSVDPILFTVYAIGFIAGTLLFRFFSVLGYAQRDFVLPTTVEAGGNALLLLALGWVSVFHSKAGLPVFFLLFYAMPLLCGLVVYGSLRVRHKALFAAPGKGGVHFPSLFRYSGLAFLSNLAFWGVYRMDYWWVAAYCSARELGNYIQAAKLAQLFVYLPQVIAMVIFPDVVQGMASGSRETIRKLMGYTVGIYALSLPVILLLGYKGLPWLLGPSFDQVYPAFLRLVPGIFALGPLTILAAWFAALNKIRTNLYGGMVALAVMLGGDLLFIPSYHIMGAAWVSSAAYITYLIYEWVAFS
jgi:O-antigen/teichoic acid export membrane protein